MNGVVLNQRENILLWLQKYYVYYKFKPDDVFVQSILYLHFCICFMGHEMEKKETRKINKFGFHCARYSVRLLSAWCDGQS